MRIEPLSITHAEIIAEIHKEAFDENWTAQAFADLIGLPASFGFVCCNAENEPMGFILCQGDENEAEIITIATARSHRRKGVAQKLFKDAFARTSKMFLEVAQDNPGAIAFYKGEGFTQVGKRPRYYKRSDGTRVDALVFELST